jgi:hypothetical protein
MLLLLTVAAAAQNPSAPNRSRSSICQRFDFIVMMRVIKNVFTFQILPIARTIGPDSEREN